MICEISPELSLLASLDSSFSKSPSYRRIKRFHSNRPKTVEPSYTYKKKLHEHVLELDLPGVERSDLVVEVQGRKLTVTGKRMRETDELPNSKKAKTSENEAREEEDKTAQNALNNELEEPVVDMKDKDNDAEGKGKHDEDARNDRNEGPSVDNAKVALMYKAQFQLHPRIDADAIFVERYQNGVLKLMLPHRKDYIREIRIS